MFLDVAAAAITERTAGSDRRPEDQRHLILLLPRVMVIPGYGAREHTLRTTL